MQHYHQPEVVLQIRRFIDAVLEYTEAPEIDIIAHSMGVAYSRRAVKGGWASTFVNHSVGGSPYPGNRMGQLGSS